ncbi:putative reverse transcriptase domain [Abeliophyllum distichum]|uniref:Reverse transcriptase domain n=1 Tax=Abeliophyllum distichum TaxID=126358 RepID=A0ABD1TKN2_9LAMI
MNRFWEEFYSYPEDISFFEWAYLKTFKQKPTINTFQDKSKIWKTTFGNTFQSVHPLLEEIVIPKGDVKVIASPLKQPVQNELVKQDKVKGKEKAYEKTTNTSKTLFKPNEDKVHFGSGTSDVLLEILKQLHDKESLSKINVINSIEELQEQFEELKINKLKDKSFAKHPLTHFYPRPTFPDMLLEEPRSPQKSFSGLEVIAWDIDGMTEHQIMQVISEMSMASSAYSAKGNTDKEVAVNIYNGFSGQLKNWWFNYLFSDEREKVINAVKKEGEPSPFMEKSSELLMNLTCPKLQDFRWYKDIFLQKVMLRDDCKSAFWKERFIAGLRKLFAERVRCAIKDEHSNLPYDDLTFGQIIGFITKEGLSLCNDLKLKAKLKSKTMEGRKELGSFCEQYGYERIQPPPSRTQKFSQKTKYQKKKKYFNKNFIPDYYKKTPSKFHRHSKNKHKRRDRDKLPKVLLPVTL